MATDPKLQLELPVYPPRYAVRFDEGLDDVIVIDGVPVVDESRQQKLFETVQKRFKTQAGIEVDLEGMHIPYGEDGKSKG